MKIGTVPEMTEKDTTSCVWCTW